MYTATPQQTFVQFYAKFCNVLERVQFEKLFYKMFVIFISEIMHFAS